MGAGELLARELAANVAVIIENGFNGANRAACTAVDAEHRIDVMNVVTRPVYRIRRASVRAGGTTDAPFDDFVGHGLSL
jgi:hypothetical protein